MTAATSASEPLGRRERKKAATRKAISDVATQMFLQRGFDQVSIKEIAEAADVSPTTVFTHFPVKEAILFDEDDKMRADLADAVRGRPRSTTVIAALHAYLEKNSREMTSKHQEVFWELVASTPSLSDYAKNMWMRHADGLAAALAEEAGLETPTWEISAFAAFVVQAQVLAVDADDPQTALAGAFTVLRRGWPDYAESVGLD